MGYKSWTDTESPAAEVPCNLVSGHLQTQEIQDQCCNGCAGTVFWGRRQAAKIPQFGVLGEPLLWRNGAAHATESATHHRGWICSPSLFQIPSTMMAPQPTINIRACATAGSASTEVGGIPVQQIVKIYRSKHAVDFPMRETWLCIFCK